MFSTRRPSHRPVWSCLLLVCALGVAAASAATPPKVLHFGNAVEPQDLDPQSVTGVYEARILRALLEGLVCTGADQSVTPGVAKSWEISPDGLVYTFHLRADARWSTGAAVTALDFVRSYRRLLTPSFGAPYADRFYYVAGAEAYHRGTLRDFSQTGFQALDPQTLQLTLHQPAPFLLDLMTRVEWLPVPMEVIEKVGPADRPGNRWTRPEHFVGNGPFLLTSWRAGQKIVVSRSPTYWDRSHLKLDEIHFYPVENPEVEERMFRTGQLHVTSALPLTKIAAYRREASPALRIDPWGGLNFYVFNVKRAPFNDVRVRRAFSLAVDREAIVKNVSLAGDEPAYHTVPNGLAGYRSNQGFTMDVTEARRLLAEAGYPGGKGIAPIQLLYNTSENHRAVAEAVQQMWRKNLGVSVSLTNQEWKVYLDTVKSTRDFQIARSGWLMSEPHLHLDRWATGNANNDANWSHSGFDRLLQASLAAPTLTARYELYQQMEKIMVDEMPILPIYFVSLARLINPKVTGYRTTTSDSYPWKETDLLP
ncbi:MAG: peptide ABC transporter substrate-binding protein [Opitutaceae bacterium]